MDKEQEITRRKLLAYGVAGTSMLMTAAIGVPGGAHVLAEAAEENNTGTSSSPTTVVDASLYEVQATGSTHARPLADWFGDVVNVKSFGAVGDGITDDTTAIEAARAALVRRYGPISPEPAWLAGNGPVLYFPAGDYVYNGEGLAPAAGKSNIFRIAGDGSEVTRIQLGSASWFIRQSASAGFSLSGIHFYGGYGAVKFTGSGKSVVRFCMIENCVFSEYAKAAISHLSQDWPYFKIRNNLFRGRADSDTIGIVISGYSANSEITNNDFQCNKYHIKLRTVVLPETDNGPATPISIYNNGFIRYPHKTTLCWDIWFVPNAETAKNAGRGILLFMNKFGNESIKAGESRILVADEEPSSGADGSEYSHRASPSTGYLSGLCFSHNNIVSKTVPNIPFLYSYTANLFNFTFQDQYDGTPSHMIEYDSSLLADLRQSGFNTNTRTHLFSYERFIPGQTGALPNPLSNVPGVFFTEDPFGFGQEQGQPIAYQGGGDWGGYTSLLVPDSTASFSAAGSASKLAVDNDIGEIGEASEVRLQANSGGARLAGGLSMPAMRIGEPVWIEFSLRRSAALPLEELTVQIVDGSGSIDFRRRLRMPTGSGWHRYRYLWTPRYNSGTSSISVRFITEGYIVGVAEYATIGRVKVYHAREPVQTGHLQSMGSEWNRSHLVLGQYHFWVDQDGMLRIKQGAPTHDEDGGLVAASNSSARALNL